MRATLDERITSPIATRSEVSTLLAIPGPRLSSWAAPTGSRKPLVHTVRSRSTRLTFPLVSIAEASTLNALRASGLTMQNIRGAAEFIRRESNDEYALASPRFVTDGTDAFFQEHGEIIRVRDQQRAFREVIRDHLRPLVIGPDGFVEAFTVERFASEVTIDPRYNAGQMSFVRNRVPLFAVSGAIDAGESLEAISGDFELTLGEVIDVADHLAFLRHFG